MTATATHTQSNATPTSGCYKYGPKNEQLTVRQKNKSLQLIKGFYCTCIQKEDRIDLCILYGHQAVKLQDFLTDSLL